MIDEKKKKILWTMLVCNFVLIFITIACLVVVISNNMTTGRALRLTFSSLFLGINLVLVMSYMLRIRPSVRYALTKTRHARIERPPLMLLDSILRFLWTKKTYDRVFSPARSDIVHDWQQAHFAGETKRAWYIKHVLGRGIMLSHAAAQLPWSIIKFFVSLFEVSK